MNQIDRIEILVEKFLEGRTTNAEEKVLYAWFRSNDIPKDWEYMREMFAWYEDGMPERAPQQTKSAISMFLRRVVRWASSIAAAVIVGIVVWININASSNDYAYDEVFIVENGIRYDNINDIAGDIEAMMNRAEDIESLANELLAWAEL